MIIMKFGGTSLRDAPAIKTVCEIVRARLDARPVVVVSAVSGVTDALEVIGRTAVDRSADLGWIRERHETLHEDLDVRESLDPKLFQELEDLCRGISLVGELSPRSRDYILSFGERLSARLVAAALNKAGIPATAVDAFDIGVRTDSHFGRAQLLADDGRIKRALAKLEGIPVITGFIAKDEKGNTSTLGRNGSDLSAAFLGNAIDAEEIQIWTDVDGVLTADPRVVETARPIARMSYDEAAELANSGGKVLHPSSLAPAIEKQIPVRVLNTHRPDAPGTLIVPEHRDPNAVVRCIAHKRHVTLVNIQTTRMLDQPGFLATIFRVFAAHGISVDMVSTSEVSVSVTLDNTENLDAAIIELGKHAEIDVHEDLGQLCVVGHDIGHRMGLPARIFQPLMEHGVEVKMISLGALKVNVSLVVDEANVETAVRALHEEFFG